MDLCWYVTEVKTANTNSKITPWLINLLFSYLLLDVTTCQFLIYIFDNHSVKRKKKTEIDRCMFQKICWGISRIFFCKCLSCHPSSILHRLLLKKKKKLQNQKLKFIIFVLVNQILLWRNNAKWILFEFSYLKKITNFFFFFNFPCIFEISRNDNNILPYFIFQKFENHNLQQVILNWWFGKNIYLMTQILRIICKSAIVCYGNLCCILRIYQKPWKWKTIWYIIRQFGTFWYWLSLTWRIGFYRNVTR